MSKRHRADIQGLRALAVALVLAFHAGLPLVRAGYVGVDVFFVISGFLITGLLMRERTQTGRIDVKSFYARRARRLLPAATVVLVATGVGGLVVLKNIRWSELGGDLISAAAYVVNWRLADRSVDYLAEDSAASPVQHFWSLAVEEQFYLVWPLLLLALTRPGRGRRPAIALGVIGLGSLAWSIHLSAQAPAAAFFVTTTRLWELAIGAGAALLVARGVPRLPAPLTAAIGWAGLAGILASAVLYSSLTPWPSYAALLPTLSTAAVILAGSASTTYGPATILGVRPLQWIGELSYSLYLWHWPLLALTAAHLGHDLTAEQGLLVVAASIVPAWLTYRFVENPIRYAASGKRRTLVLAAGLTATSACTGLVLIALIAIRMSGPAITPDPLAATKDVPDSYARGCQVLPRVTEPVSCEYGDRDGDHTIAVVGDSKALQWITALDRIGERRGWRIRTYTKSACAFTAATIDLRGKAFDTCTRWNQAVVEALLADPPDVMLTSQGKPTALNDPTDLAEGLSQTAMSEGLRARWQQLSQAGIPIAVLRDNPKPPVAAVYSCVDEHRRDVQACDFERAAAERRSAGDAQLAAAMGLDDVTVIDLNNELCRATHCQAVIDGVLVYRQGSHLTATFVNRMRPHLERALVPIVEDARKP